MVLGDEIHPIQGKIRKEMEGNVIIQPMVYNIVVERAKSRLLKLYDRVKEAPFLDDLNNEMNGDHSNHIQMNLAMKNK